MRKSLQGFINTKVNTFKKSIDLLLLRHQFEAVKKLLKKAKLPKETRASWELELANKYDRFLKLINELLVRKFIDSAQETVAKADLTDEQQSELSLKVTAYLARLLKEVCELVDDNDVEAASKKLKEINCNEDSKTICSKLIADASSALARCNQYIVSNNLNGLIDLLSDQTIPEKTRDFISQKLDEQVALIAEQVN